MYLETLIVQREFPRGRSLGAVADKFFEIDVSLSQTNAAKKPVSAVLL